MSGRSHNQARSAGTRSLQTFLCLALALPVLLGAQSPSPSRLEQLEATYMASLRPLHAPVLQDYLRQLELLKNQFISRNRMDDARQVDAEIQRVKAIISTSGVLPYNTPSTSPTSAAPATTTSPPVQTTPDSGPLPTFLAAEAFKSGDMNTKLGAVPIGSAEWRVFRLPAGTYDLLIVFSCEALPLPEIVTVRIGGQQVKATIAPDRATGAVDSFRLLRLCSLTLDADVTSGTLAIEGSDAGGTRIWLRKIMFARPRPPKS